MLTLQPGDWPEFRGADRTGAVPSVEIHTNWTTNPPKERWRQPVGPGWSSFTVVDGRVFTQEQLGPDELVVCRDAETGEQLWTHAESTRFEEAVAGAGPRSTPTFAEGWLYAQSANGTVLCLNAGSGAVRWKFDLVRETGSEIPQWGFSASPLVHSGLVTVFGGAPGKALVSLHAETGQLAWASGDGKLSYCSPQLFSVRGLDQLLMCTSRGLVACEPESGTVLWEHEWPTEGIARIVQPCQLENGDFLIGTGLGVGTRRIAVEHRDNVWSTREVWSTVRFKPYFNDFVIHNGHLYGFDGAIFMCAGLDDGEVRWRTRGYGSGQALLLSEQGVLLIISEKGELAVVTATSDKHEELSRLPSIDGKTWNHPAVAHNRLYVRNGAEAVCYDLPVVTKSAPEPAEN